MAVVAEAGTSGDVSKTCSICSVYPPCSGEISCGHQFCTSCFTRYVIGSLEDLNTYLRCTICGKTSILTTETKNESVLFSFGRDLDPKLRLPTGVALTPNGDFVIFDKIQNRGYLFNNRGKLKMDFSFVHKAVPMDGIGVTSDGTIVAPFSDNKFGKYIAYFSDKGRLLTTAYLDPQENRVVITAVAVSRDDHVALADCGNAAIHLLHPVKRHIRSIRMRAELGETLPKPMGVTFNSTNQIIVSDAANHKLLVFDFEGTLLFTTGSKGSQTGQFKSPHGISVDAGDRIFVADRGNCRVQILTPEGAFIRYLVRLTGGVDVHSAPKDVVNLAGKEVAVLLTGIREPPAAEVRIYPYSLDQF